MTCFFFIIAKRTLTRPLNAYKYTPLYLDRNRWLIFSLPVTRIDIEKLLKRKNQIYYLISHALFIDYIKINIYTYLCVCMCVATIWSVFIPLKQAQPMMYPIIGIKILGNLSGAKLPLVTYTCFYFISVCLSIPIKLIFFSSLSRRLRLH